MFIYLLFAEKKMPKQTCSWAVGKWPRSTGWNQSSSRDWCRCSLSFCPFKLLEITWGFSYLKGVVWPWSPKTPFRCSHHPTVAPNVAGEIQGEIHTTDSIHLHLLPLRTSSMITTTVKRATPVLPCLGFLGWGGGHQKWWAVFSVSRKL